MKSLKTVPKGLDIAPQTVTADTVRTRTSPGKDAKAPRRRATPTQQEQTTPALAETLKALTEAVEKQNVLFDRLIQAVEQLPRLSAATVKPYNPTTFRESIFGPGGINT